VLQLVGLFPMTLGHVRQLPPKTEGDTGQNATPQGTSIIAQPSPYPRSSNLTWIQPPEHPFQSPQQPTPPSAHTYMPVFTMAGPTTSTPSRFVAKTETLEDMRKMPTVGLVHLSESTKRRVELAEQWDREAAEKLQPICSSGGGGAGPASSSWEGSEAPTGSGGKRTKKRM